MVSDRCCIPLQTTSALRREDSAAGARRAPRSTLLARAILGDIRHQAGLPPCLPCCQWGRIHLGKDLVGKDPLGMPNSSSDPLGHGAHTCDAHVCCPLPHRQPRMAVRSASRKRRPLRQASSWLSSTRCFLIVCMRLGTCSLRSC